MMSIKDVVEIIGTDYKDNHSYFIDNMPDGFVRLDIAAGEDGRAEDYVIMEVNKSLEQLTGMKKEKVLGKRVSEIAAEKPLANDLLEIFRRAGNPEENDTFEYYSEKLKKWHMIYSFKSGKDSLCVLFRDITEAKIRTEKIKSLYESTVRFYDAPYMDIDYQWIAEELLALSGAAFVLVNVFDRETMKTITRGFSGVGKELCRIIKLLGYDVLGKAWDVTDTDIEAMKSKKLMKMGRLHEFNFGRTPPAVVKLLEKLFRMGEAYGMGIKYRGEILGGFIIIMRDGDRIDNTGIVELFVNQLGIMLLRKKAEEEVSKIDHEYRTVFNSSQDAMFLINVDSDKSFTYHMVNKGYEMDVGIPAETVKGMTPQELYGDEIGNQIAAHYLECITAQKTVTYEEAFIFRGTKKVWHTLLSPVMNEGNVIQIVGSSRNITKLKQWEDEVARERQFFKITLHSIGDAVITTNTENRIVLINKAAAALTGWKPEEARGKRLDEVMKTSGIKRHDALERWTDDAQTGGGEQVVYKTLISKNGDKRIISCSEASIRDENTSILGEVIVFRDVSLEKQKEEEVRYLGYHDALTGLYNRAYFEKALLHMDEVKYLPLGLIIGDSNGLKMVNDVFGHEEGDKLLKNIAGIFKAACGSEDIAARIGGDEFAIILPRTGNEEVNSIISRIKQMCGIETAEPISPSIALGSAIKTDKAQSIKEVYKLAEDRMYNNKLVESKSIRSSILLSLKKTLEERTHETEAHARRLKELAVEIGKTMALHDNELDELSLLAMLHDIGKIAIPDYILGKPESLSEEEWKIMKSHCEIGYRIAVASPELAHIADLILSHHERWDGTGYPQGLKGDEIPLLSRIITVADAYDAMTSDRPYHTAVSRETALEELERCSGTQFDPLIVEKAIDILKS